MQLIMGVPGRLQGDGPREPLGVLPQGRGSRLPLLWKIIGQEPFLLLAHLLL